MELTKRDIERFWSKVDKRNSDDCWNWNAGTNNSGYGKIAFSKRGQAKYYSAHRLSFELANGPVPDGLHVLHNCPNNRRCVNPAHLRLGTNDDNALDRLLAFTEPRVLTDTERAEIRYWVGEGVSTHKIGAWYGIDPRRIRAIVRLEEKRTSTVKI